MALIRPNINVYPVVDVSTVVGARDTLSRALVEMPGQGDGGLTISEVSGCMYYADDRALWKNTGASGLPSTSKNAKGAAERWLATSRARLKDVAHKLPFNAAAVLPEELQASVARPVWAPGVPLPDHWLIVYGLSLQTGLSGSPAAVPADASLELRLGSGGSVVGLSSTVRIIGKPAKAKLVAPPSGGGSLFYRVGGPDDPQTHLAPFYLQMSGDGGTEWPASSKSLLVRIADGATAGMLTASVLYGEQFDNFEQFEFSWGAWRPDGLAPGLVALGTGNSVRLPGAGVYNVVLDVRHRDGQGARVQRLIYSFDHSSDLVA